jgi:myo-inositol-1(or 4)-monophosphatase
MPPAPSASEPDWLGLCRRATQALREIFAATPTTRQRAAETGERGEGGDLTLEIDREAERAVFGLLEEVHQSGQRFVAVSEERGEVDYGGGEVRVVIDPIDGSLNAKRDLPHHALSIAVSGGPTMADVNFAYVYDFGPGEEWVARQGEGATLNGAGLDPAAGERRNQAGKLELLGLESADPRWVAEVAAELPAHAARVRALGSIAITLCQVAAARLDGMFTIKRTRAVDAAAGQLIVREAGGHVAFPGCPDPLAAPLDVEARSPVVAARTERTLAELSQLPRP